MMFSVDSVLRRLREDESYQSAPYQCTSKVWSIGFGSTHHVDGFPITEDTRPISIATARTLLKASVMDAIEDCQAIYGNSFAVLHPVHQEILICLAYQLGRSRLQGFERMNSAIKQLDYEGWKRELLDSRLASQARKRVGRYIVAIDACRWDWD